MATMSRLKTAIGNRPWTVLGATTFLGVSGYQKVKEEKRLWEDAKKKKVLVLPFHRMKIVEEKKSPVSSMLNRFGNGEPGAEQVIEMQADELVSLIHEAAEDPSIVSLYGVFGNGGTMSTGGWAHLEEIRNALENFAKKSSKQEIPENELSDTAPKGKAMYAYSNTFGGTESMKEYYLASVFPVIHLQPQGDLNLYGLHTTNTFFRDFLKKYGVTVHVWKHGVYKNMANVFTHSNYSKEHYENTAGYLLPIHKHVREAIYKSRQKQFKQYSYSFDKFWSMIENAGSFPADIAHEIGFVDHLPLKNPLYDLVKNNKKPKVAVEEGTGNSTDTSSNTNADDENAVQVVEEEEKLESTIISSEDSSVGDQWKSKTDPDSFTADSQITIDAYARKKAKERRKKVGESDSPMDQLLSIFSEEKAKKLKEKIVVIKINGVIGETVARKAEKALRKVKGQEDVKCVVLRIDSRGGSINACESLYQEIQDIPQKVVVSFGNVSASGGYYISSSADQIFASSSTITGSIGVVMMRMDFKELAKRYGITFDSVATSALSGSNDPFYPINKEMNENFANQADRSYHRFKSLVSIGRNMDMKAVEKIAKGRVYTGEKAHQVGLVDELGGLDEAITFAQKNYTSSGDAQVVHWPPKKSLWEFLKSRGQNEDGNDIDDLDLPDIAQAALEGFASILGSSGSEKSNFLFNTDTFSFSSPPVTSGVMLTLDENSAIECMLEDANVSKQIFAYNDIINSIP